MSLLPYKLDRLTRYVKSDYLAFTEEYYKNKENHYKALHLEFYTSVKDQLISKESCIDSWDDAEEEITEIQEFYNTSDLYITIIYPTYQDSIYNSKVFLAIDDFHTFLDVVDESDGGHPRLFIDPVIKDPNFIKFKKYLKQYCGVPANDKVYAHRLICSIYESCKDLIVHHKDLIGGKGYNHPCNLVALSTGAHNIITNLEKNGATTEVKDEIIIKDRAKRNALALPKRSKPDKLSIRDKVKICYEYYVNKLSVTKIPSRFHKISLCSKTIYNVLNEYGLFTEYYTHYVLFNSKST